MFWLLRERGGGGGGKNGLNANPSFFFIFFKIRHFCHFFFTKKKVMFYQFVLMSGPCGINGTEWPFFIFDSAIRINLKENFHVYR